MYGILDRINVIDRIDHLAKRLNQDEIASVLGDDLVFESVTLEDLENTYLFQCETVSSMILEAFQAKASMLDSRIRKFANQVGTKLTTVEVGNIEIGKPRKSGAVAVQIAKINLSDGQSISIAFHAPDNDPLKVNPTDTLIAFRFMLNTRDITHTMAAKGNLDISLKEATTKLGQLVEANTARFQASQAQKFSDAKALEEAQQRAADLEEQTAALNEEMDSMIEQTAQSERRAVMLQKQIDSQNQIQEELRNQISKKQAASVNKNPNGSNVSYASFNEQEFQANLSGKDKETIERLRSKGFQVMFEQGQGYSIVNPEGIVVNAGTSYPTFKEQIDYLAEQLNIESATSANSEKPQDQYANYGYLVEQSRAKPTSNSFNKLKPTDIENGNKFVIKYGEHCYVVVDKVDSGVRGEWVVAGGLYIYTEHFPSVSKLKFYGTQMMDKFGKTVEENLFKNSYTQEELDRAARGGAEVVPLPSSARNINDLGDDYDESGDSDDHDNSIKGINKYAGKLGITVSSIVEDAENFEPNMGDVSRVTLTKNGQSIHIQVAMNGKMAVFDLDGNRIDQVGQYPFFGLYSNDPQTLQERLRAFATFSDAKTSALDDGTIDSAKAVFAKKVLPDLVAALTSDAKTGKRSKLSEGLKAQMREMISELEIKGLRIENNEAVAQLSYAQGSVFVDTAISELVNGGWTEMPVIEKPTKQTVLNKVGDVVRMGDGVYQVERIDLDRDIVILYDREDDYRFTVTKDEVENAGLFFEGMHQQHDLDTTELPLVLELKPIIKDLPTDGWFYENGRASFKLFDDVYDALVAAGYTSDSARFNAQALKNEIDMGNIDYASKFHDKVEEPLPLEPEEKQPIGDTEDVDAKYWYGLRARPYGFGTVPGDAKEVKVLSAEDAAKKFPNAGANVRHGAIAYTVQLSAAQVSSFELIPLFGDVQPDAELAEMIARQALLDWAEIKELSSIPENEFLTLKQAVSLGSFKSVFAKVLRNQVEYKNRKSDPEEYKEWNASMTIIDAEFLDQVAREMGVITANVVSDNADESEKGFTAEEQTLLALDATSFKASAAYEQDGEKDVKNIARTIRAFITGLRRSGDIPGGTTFSVTTSASTINLAITGLPTSIRLYADERLQHQIDNPDQPEPLGLPHYSKAVSNLMDYVNAYVAQFNYSGQNATEEAQSVNFQGGKVSVNAAFSEERMVEELQSFTDMHQKGTEAEKTEIDVNGIRNGLDEEGKLQLEQLEEFTTFEIKLGKQDILLPDGKTKSRTIKDETDVEWVISELHEFLVDALERKAEQQLDMLTNWQSDSTYYGQDIIGQINIGNALSANPSSSDGIDGLYGRNHIKAWLSTKHVSIYPIFKDGEYKFSVYLDEERLGEGNDHADIEMLAIMGLELSTEPPSIEEPVETEETMHIKRLTDIRDYDGEVTIEVLEQFQTELEQAVAYFTEAGNYAENEGLVEAAFANYIELQSRA